MAFSPAPPDWLTSWSEDGTNITVPLATFPEMTAAEADAATGDIRKILFAIAEKCYATYNGKAAADRPNQMVITKAVSVNPVTGIVTNSYTFKFYCTIGTQEVAAE